MVSASTLELSATYEPSDAAEVADLVRAAHDAEGAVYPWGGQTALDYGLPGRKPGWGVSLARAKRVIDYPARDLTITVEAGITLAELAATMQAERQWLPLDVPRAGQATLGGAIATNTSGPRRYGQGTIRDYVIGITAVDGRGVTFHGGGRVVKNVAGYDFCRLLTGSLGTLGVITQVTLKVKPRPEDSAFVAHDLASWDEAELLLSALVTSRTTPTAIELLCGPDWADDPALGPLTRGAVARLVVGLEGAAPEVAWMQGQLQDEWRGLGAREITTVEAGSAAGLWERLAEFPAREATSLVGKLTVPPSRLAELVRRVVEVDPGASFQAHAGNGVLKARFARPAGEMAGAWVKELQPAAIAALGSAVLLSGGSASDLTRQAVWGGTTPSTSALAAVKRQFDPRHVLNPGRYLFS